MNNAGSNRTIGPCQRFLLLTITVILLTGCHFPANQNPEFDSAGKQLDDFSVPLINIHFTVRLHQPLQQEQTILIEILDEVTGLSNNSEIVELRQADELEYAIEKSFPAGSIVKYRYIRSGDSQTPESQPEGNPVRYRLAYISKPSQITDHIAAWQGEIQAQSSGVLSGTIQDRVTHNPLPDILVSAGGQLTFTDANGYFLIDGLPAGVHNMVAYAIDGSFQPFQQGAEIADGLTTPASIDLQAMPAVQVRFNVTPPGDARGAPIYFAGNLAQLGNTFGELSGSMSLFPKKMPLLTAHDDGSHSISLTLYAGVDLRYKFTLGDGLWNSEQDSTGETITHQLIVPNQDITIDQTIASWRTPNIEPITFEINIPPENAPPEEIFIQFRADDWTEPLPLWPLGGAQYLYILFSPLEDLPTVGYRFCRGSQCHLEGILSTDQGEIQVVPGGPSQRVTVSLESWEDWKPVKSEPEPVNPIPLPSNPSNYATIIELTPEMAAAWEVYAPVGLSTLAQSGTSSVIFSPRWNLQPGDIRLKPQLGSTPFFYWLSALLHSAKSFNLQRGIFPQIHQEGVSDAPWSTAIKTKQSRDNWQASYQQFILNYAKIAEITQTQWLIIGGDAYRSEIAQDPGFWQGLLSDVHAAYQGQVLWAAHIHAEADPLPEWIDDVDGLYLMIDTPLSTSITTSASVMSSRMKQ